MTKSDCAKCTARAIIDVSIYVSILSAHTSPIYEYDNLNVECIYWEPDDVFSRYDVASRLTITDEYGNVKDSSYIVELKSRDCSIGRYDEGIIWVDKIQKINEVARYNHANSRLFFYYIPSNVIISYDAFKIERCPRVSMDAQISLYDKSKKLKNFYQIPITRDNDPLGCIKEIYHCNLSWYYDAVERLYSDLMNNKKYSYNKSKHSFKPR